jgi:ketosteroid isomerase-like protein
MTVLLQVAGHAWSADLSDSDVRAIREVTQRYADTAVASNWDAWAMLLTADAMFLPPNGAAVEGRVALRSWVLAFSGLSSLTETPEEIVGRDGLAYGRGKYAYTFGAHGPSQGSGDSGAWIKIYEKQKDGTWRIKRNIWNSSRPLQER